MIGEHILAALPTLITGIAGVGGGSILTRWWAHRRAVRQQDSADERSAFDEAMSLCTRLQHRIEALEVAGQHEREAAALRESAYRHELKQVEGVIDMLIIAVEIAHTMPDKAAEIVTRAKDRRGRSPFTPPLAAIHERKGELRQEAQIELSSRRVLSGEDA